MLTITLEIIILTLEVKSLSIHYQKMSDLEELLNCGLLSDENGISSETRALLISEEFSQVVNYKEDTFIVTQGSKPDAF
jgi:hypothetical protein